MDQQKQIDELELKLKLLEARLENETNRINNLNSSGADSLPRTALLSEKFIKRAFAVWGHAIAAQIILVVSFYAVIFVFAILFSGFN